MTQVPTLLPISGDQALNRKQQNPATPRPPLSGDLAFRRRGQPHLPAALLVGGETVEFAPGATVKGSFRCSISPEERRRIAEVDLAHADTADAEAFYNRNPPEPRRLRGAYERIPDAVRPNLAVVASFDILNA